MLRSALAALIGLTGVGLPAQLPIDRVDPGPTCTVIADARTGETLVRDGICDQQFSPTSSFKLPLAVMGFDSGILQSPTAPAWSIGPDTNASERERAFPDVDPALWLQQSIVWYSQRLTTELGEVRFADYVNRFDYGSKDVSGDPGEGNGLTRSWLMSSLAISPDEQIAFLLKFAGRRLPVSPQSYDLTRATVPEFGADGGWTVHGKTGSGTNKQGRPQGWFVGWADKDGREVVFARLEVGVAESGMVAGAQARTDLLTQLPGLIVGR
jgi:beta-lactamase class D